jgi:uncharacterized membrane protein YphA (DoxX/SURF4 family)
VEKLTKTAGRIIYGLVFLIFGVNHLIRVGMVKGIVPGWLPVPAFWVILTGIGMIVAGVFIVLKLKGANVVSLLLALLLFIYILTLHVPGMIAGQGAMTNFLKDAGLMGAALVFSSLFKSGDA